MKKVLKIAAAVLALVGLAYTLSAADSLRVTPAPGQPFPVVLSSNGANTNGTACTNGLYPCSISLAGTAISMIEIPNTGNSLAIQFTAQTAGSVSTNAVLVLASSVMPPNMSYTDGVGWTNKNPWQTYGTHTIACAGGLPSTTNIVYTASTTPAKGALPHIYVYSIGIGVGAGAVLTNYSVWACAQ